MRPGSNRSDGRCRHVKDSEELKIYRSIDGYQSDESGAGDAYESWGAALLWPRAASLEYHCAHVYGQNRLAEDGGYGAAGKAARCPAQP